MDGGNDIDEFPGDLYCPACDKSFKSDKAMKNHEKSKKHREMVVLLRQQLEEEDESLSLVSADRDGDEDEVEEEDEEAERDDASRQKLSKKQKKKKRQQKTIYTPQNVAEEPKAASPVPDSGEGVTPPAQKDSNEDFSALEYHIEEMKKDGPERNKNSGRPKSKKGGKDSKKNIKAQGGGEVGQEKELNLRCVTCQYEFSSRNKLFDHLKTTGHATVLQCSMTTNTAKSKKEKRKNK